MTSIACLGDSITFGEGCSLGLGWVGRLNAYLQHKQPHEHMVYNLGICGDRLANAYNRYFSEVLLRYPKIVLIAIGTNDCQRAGTETPDELASGFQRLFYQWQVWSKHLSAGLHKTIILGVLPSNETQMPYIYPGEPYNWVLNKDLKTYNEYLKDFCAQANLPFIDFWPHWTDDMTRTHSLDGVHPNDKGYDVMFDIIKNTLETEQFI